MSEVNCYLCKIVNHVSIQISITVRNFTSPGVDLVGGGSAFWGTPKLHKEGKNVTRMHANTLRFSI